MKTQLKQHTKAKVALEAIKGQKTGNELATELECIPRKLRSGRSEPSTSYLACLASKQV